MQELLEEKIEESDVFILKQDDIIGYQSEATCVCVCVCESRWLCSLVVYTARSCAA